MLFAEYFGDSPAFDIIWDWTARTLRRPHDSLHAWRYVPGAPWPIADPNNATDGDLFIAMALSRAARRWKHPLYAADAAAIGRDVLRLLVRKAGGRTLLLPAAQGFETEASLVVNPSYIVFPALQELGHRVRSPVWDTLQQDGIALIEDGRFGRWKLPPDWLQVSRHGGQLAPAPNWPPRFSYDAIRIPLYLTWSRLMPPDPLAMFQQYWANTAANPPAWVDLATGAAAPYAAPPGMLAINLLTTGAAAPDLPSAFPTVASAPDYYSAALILLCRLAWREIRPV